MGTTPSCRRHFPTGGDPGQPASRSPQQQPPQRRNRRHSRPAEDPAHGRTLQVRQASPPDVDGGTLGQAQPNIRSNPRSPANESKATLRGAVPLRTQSGARFTSPLNPEPAERGI